MSSDSSSTASAHQPAAHVGGAPNATSSLVHRQPQGQPHGQVHGQAHGQAQCAGQPPSEPLTEQIARSFAQPGFTEEQAVLLEIFGRQPVTYHRAFADLTQSITAALWLSYALQISQQADTTDVDFTREMCFEALGLTRREQDAARAKLRKAGLITEARVGRRLMYTLHLNVIAQKLLEVCTRPWMKPDAKRRGSKAEGGGDRGAPQHTPKSTHKGTPKTALRKARKGTDQTTQFAARATARAAAPSVAPFEALACAGPFDAAATADRRASV